MDILSTAAFVFLMVFLVVGGIILAAYPFHRVFKEKDYTLGAWADMILLVPLGVVGAVSAIGGLATLPADVAAVQAAIQGPPTACSSKIVPGSGELGQKVDDGQWPNQPGTYHTFHTASGQSHILKTTCDWGKGLVFTHSRVTYDIYG